MWFSKPDSFNDPFDCYEQLIQSFSTVSELRSYLKRKNIYDRKKHTDDKLFEVLTTSPNWASEEVRKRTYGICSFSKTLNHILLWSHYADNHKEICLAFDPRLFDKNYQENLYHIIYEESKFRRYRYSDRRNDAILLSMIRKSDVWKYEDESRIVLTNCQGNNSFRKEALVEIIFGYNCNKSQENKIREVISENGYSDIKFHKAHRYKNEFALYMRNA